jgi:hypothetical protein
MFFFKVFSFWPFTFVYHHTKSETYMSAVVTFPDWYSLCMVIHMHVVKDWKGMCIMVKKMEGRILCNFHFVVWSYVKNLRKEKWTYFLEDRRLGYLD